MNNKKRIIISILIVFLIIVVFSSATYAVYKWRSTYGLNVGISVTDNITIVFNGGTNVAGRLVPTSSPLNGFVKKISIRSNLPTNDTFNLYLKTTTLPSALQVESFKWILTECSSSDFYDCDGDVIYEEGNFSASSMSEYIDSGTGDLLLLEGQGMPFRNNLDLYLYFWIDGSVDNATSMQNQSISFDLYATGNTEGTLSEVTNN